jgi:hypothetical protein
MPPTNTPVQSVIPVRFEKRYYTRVKNACVALRDVSEVQHEKTSNHQIGKIHQPEPLGEPGESKAAVKARYFREQEKLFNSKRSILLEAYRGQFVLFEDGEILEHDIDESSLLRKALKRMADRSYFFVKQVLEEDPIYRVTTPVDFSR